MQDTWAGGWQGCWVWKDKQQVFGQQRWARASGQGTGSRNGAWREAHCAGDGRPGEGVEAQRGRWAHPQPSKMGN